MTLQNELGLLFPPAIAREAATLEDLAGELRQTEKAEQSAHAAKLQAIIRRGKVFARAKALCRGSKGQYSKWVEAQGYDGSTARKLAALANDRRLSKWDYSPVLPAAWRSLYELSRLSDEEFDAAVKGGRIHAEMSQADAIALARRGVEEPPTPATEPATSPADAREAPHPMETTWEADAEPEGAATGDPVDDDEPKHAVHYSSADDEWWSPDEIVKLAEAFLGGIDLDPCSNSAVAPNVPAAHHYTREDDGLRQPWNGKVYLNPPYGTAIRDWVEKAVAEFDKAACTELVALMPSRTDSRWFDSLFRFPRVFCTKRLTFKNSTEGRAPFPALILYMGMRVEEFGKAFSEVGRYYPPGVER